MSRFRKTLNHWGWWSVAFFALIYGVSFYYQVKYDNYTYPNYIVNDDGTVKEYERESLYYQNGNSVFWRRNSIGSPYEEIVGAEADSFIAYSKSVAVDADSVYDNLEIRSDIDRESFQKLNNVYYKDNSTVYRGGLNPVEGVPGIDVSTFETLDKTSAYARDVNNLYGYTRRNEICIISTDVDPQQLQALPFSWFVDSVSVYHFNNKTLCKLQEYEFDLATFEVIDSSYQRDINGIYYKTDKTIDVDPASFVVFAGSGAAKDSNHIIINGVIAESIDYDSFMVEKTEISGRYTLTAKDKNGEYNLLTFKDE